MVRRSLALFLLSIAAVGAAVAQKTLNPPPKDETPKAFAWSFDGEGGYLGVQTQEITRENFAKFGLRDVRGVAVEKVLEKSPAQAAGIQAGDVIVRFNGDDVTSVKKLTRLVGEVDPDHQVRLTIVREGIEREVTVTLGKRSTAQWFNGNFEFNMPDIGKIEMPDFKNLPQFKEFPDFKNLAKGEFESFDLPYGEGFIWSGGGRQIGVGVVPLTKQLSEHYKVEGGALISEVRENSPAAKAGLRAGDVIVEANGKAVKSQIDLIRIINEKKDGEVQLTIVRNGNRQTITVIPDPAKDGNFFFHLDDNSSLIGPNVESLFKDFKLVQPSMQMQMTKPMTLFFPGKIL